MLSAEAEPGISFTRYFDAGTGRLILTETDRGDRIREEGEIVAGGVRFPQKVTSVSAGTDATGKPTGVRTVITFDRITVNETVPDSTFEVPAIPTSEAPAAESPGVEPPALLPSASPAAPAPVAPPPTTP